MLMGAALIHFFLDGFSNGMGAGSAHPINTVASRYTLEGYLSQASTPPIVLPQDHPAPSM